MILLIAYRNLAETCLVEVAGYHLLTLFSETGKRVSLEYLQRSSRSSCDQSLHPRQNQFRRDGGDPLVAGEQAVIALGSTRG